MPIRYLIIAAAFFALGFAVSSHWQLLMRETERANASAANAGAIAAAHETAARLGSTITTIEGEALKGVRHAEAETDRLRAGLADGSVSLLVPASALAMPKAAACECVADGAGARLNASAWQDYLAIRAGLKRCPEKVKALQSILMEERRVGNAE